MEDRFTHWLKSELEHRKKKMYESLDLQEQKWYKAQVGMLEIVIGELPTIGEPYNEVTQEDIWAQADLAYNLATYGTEKNPV